MALARSGDGSASAPKLIQIFPKGPDIRAVDGRAWTLDAPALLAAFRRQGRPLPIDYEHAQDLKARQGEIAPAAGWIEALELRDGALWAEVEWTPKGAASVTSREYRFLSPAFTHTKDGAALELLGAALVNRPALTMTALSRAELSSPKETHAMEELLALLGLPAGSTQTHIIAAITALQTKTATAIAAAQTPSLEKFVPRADYDVALARATAAEVSIAASAKAALDAEIEREVSAAVAAGKVTPATKDYYVSTCQAAGGVTAFKAFIATALPLVGTSGLENRDPNNGGEKLTALTAEQKDVCRVMGIPEDKFVSSLAAQK